MWKRLLETVREVFDLRHQVKGHDKRIEEISTSVKGQFTDIRDLSERVLRLELELQHAREQHKQALERVQQEHSKELVHLSEQQASQRENFRLQLEIWFCDFSAACRRATLTTLPKTAGNNCEICEMVLRAPGLNEQH